MTYLYSVEGTGRLIVDGEDLGEARYDIAVSQDGTLKSVGGTLYADWRILTKALDARKATLISENGQDLEVLVYSCNAGEDWGLIHVNGLPEPQ